MADVLSDRALNRITLGRQLLLARVAMPVVDAVDHLVGLQAQVPNDPYVALWSRLDGFTPDQLGDRMLDRSVGRIVVLRGTIHLVTAGDALSMPALIQPVLDAELQRHRDHAPFLRGRDLAPVLAFAADFLAEPRTGPQLKAALQERFGDGAALAYACRNHLALVQVPPRGVWGQSSQVTTATAPAWFGRPLDPDPSIDDLVLRYLRAFGPARPADLTTWTRLTGMREVLDRLRPQLRPFVDEKGRELLDVDDAPMPDPDTPAPVRFLPEYDNVLLAHADRSRFQAEDVAALYAGGRLGIGHVLHDGVVRATWRRDGDAVTLCHRDDLPARVRREIEAEGQRLAAFIGATEVRPAR